MEPTNAVIPRTNPILAILEPITLFMAIAGDPVNAAFKLTNNSGAEVAKLTTVIPMTIFEMFSLNDKATEDLTKNSPPTTNKIKPNMIQTKLMHYDFLCLK